MIGRSLPGARASQPPRRLSAGAVFAQIGHSRPLPGWRNGFAHWPWSRGVVSSPSYGFIRLAIAGAMW